MSLFASDVLSDDERHLLTSTLLDIASRPSIHPKEA